MGLRAEIGRLFDAPGREYWWRDGIFSDEHWSLAPRKVLFMLKEANDARKGNERIPKKNFSLVETQEGNAYPIEWDGWKEMMTWPYAVLNTESSALADFDKCGLCIDDPVTKKKVEAWKVCRHQVGVMNLKKDPGGSVSDDKMLAEWALKPEHTKFLRCQFKLIDPQIVVLCGNQEFRKIVANVFGLNLPDRVLLCSERILKAIAAGPRGSNDLGIEGWPYSVHDNRLWVGFRHFAYTHFHYPDPAILFNALAGIMQSALQDPDVAAVMTGGG